MTNKYYNDAIIGNKKIIASYTEKGELQRLCYPEVDGRQFIDYFQTGVKINDSNLIYLHQDINNKYSQEYIENTNILKTNIKNLCSKLPYTILIHLEKVKTKIEFQTICYLGMTNYSTKIILIIWNLTVKTKSSNNKY